MNKHRDFYGHWDPLSNRWNLLGMLHGTVLPDGSSFDGNFDGLPDEGEQSDLLYDRGVLEMSRIAIRLRLYP